MNIGYGLMRFVIIASALRCLGVGQEVENADTEVATVSIIAFDTMGNTIPTPRVTQFHSEASGGDLSAKFNGGIATRDSLRDIQDRSGRDGLLSGAKIR